MSNVVDQNDSVASFLLSLDAEAFITQCYLRLLARTPDEDGFRFYVSALQSGTSKETLLAAFAGSDEALAVAAKRGVAPFVFSLPEAAPDPVGPDAVVAMPQAVEPEPTWAPDMQDNVTFVRTAYLQLLGREADEGGLNHYVTALQAGEISRPGLAAAFVASEEGVAQGAVLPVWAAEPPKVELAEVSGVVSTPQAIAVEQLDSDVSKTETLPTFEASTFKPDTLSQLLAMDGGAFVMAAYMAILGRPADESGYTNYLHLLLSGWSKMHVISSLAESEEGRSAVSALSGLQDGLSAYRKAQRRSLGGWYYRSVLGVESDLPLERQLRAVGSVLAQR